MWEEKVFFRNNRNEMLCGNLQYTDNPERSILILGPNPLLGGDMNNNVILAICNALKKTNSATLCFDYHGTGESQAFIDKDIHLLDYYQKLEDQKETHVFYEDVIAAHEYLKSIANIQKTCVIGYSFGAYLALKYFQNSEHVLLLSPPLDKYPTVNITKKDIRCLVANKDFLGNNTTIKIFPNYNAIDCDHFFRGQEKVIQEWILKNI